MGASARVAAPQLDGVEPGRYLERVPPGTPPFRWASTATLWRARRDTRARLLGDPSVRRRPRLVGPGYAGRIDRTDLSSFSFAVLGDPGEGDGSQHAVVPPLLAAAGDAAFLVIASDVVYPAGGRGEYPHKFFAPYRDWPAPILAVPGNHDWYDGLDGFLWCFRDGGGERPASQPGPYWVLDTRHLRLVGIDTGILGGLDAPQLAWLRRVAAERDVAKVLVTGTPLVVGGAMREDDPVLGVVHDPAHRFAAVLAGDVHNFQRYPVRTPAGRVVQHVVCGGGGAYRNTTHGIPRVALPGCDEADVRLHPLRGDSLAWLSRRYEAWAATMRRRDGTRRIPPSAIDADVAARIVADRLGLEPVRESARAAVPAPEDLAAAARVAPPAGPRGWNRFGDQYYDDDRPPFQQHLLRLDVTADALRIRCFGVTGRAEDEDDPPLEDEVQVPLQPQGLP